MFKRALWSGVHWSIAVLAGLILISAVVLAAVQWDSQRWDDGRDVFLSDRGSGGPPSPVEIRPRFAEDFYNENAFVTLLVVLDDFSPQTGQISAHVSAVVDKALYEKAYPGETPPSKIRLTVAGLYGWRVAEMPLLEESSQQFESSVNSVPIDLEAWGDPRGFPNDSYGSNNFYYIDNGLGRPSVTLLATPRLAAYHLEASVDDLYLSFLLERRQAEKLWIYTILASPVLLLISLMWLSRRQSQDVGTSALEVVVGLLALLPLRQVLVPEDINQLTWLDVILGVEFVLFIAWLAYAILRSGRQVSRG
ncbi:hypothetical protein [Modestobacter marinus]|uniref:Transmembrane protein n=1 Tax=Modestobacter marinus TaxID=477641 RepID=A0A846LRZ8_9ACTN|nr:hypothetical protein [Modestobacter marinus]NIH70157.1 hypothetical protein [Modestobacter marinus]